jgi:hypothetical protein
MLVAKLPSPLLARRQDSGFCSLTLLTPSVEIKPKPMNPSLQAVSSLVPDARRFFITKLEFR